MLHSSFDRRLYLGGFTQSQRDSFFLKYLMHVYKDEWHVINEKCKRLLESADGFSELVTQLPFVATLLANSLPDMVKYDAPQTRHQFMLRLLKLLVTKDLSERERRHMLTKEKLFGATYHEPLNLLGELALTDLFSKHPKGGFTADELNQKISSRLMVHDRRSVDNLISTLTEYQHLKTGTAETYEHFRFLDSSIQQFFAAVAFVRSPKQWQIPAFVNNETLETFWLFAAGLSSDSSPLVRHDVFQKMTSCYDPKALPPGMVETLTMMLEEAFPNLADKDTLRKHDDLFRHLSKFLNRQLHFCRRWARLKRPFTSISHALHLLPDIKSVTVYTMAPPRSHAHAEVGSSFGRLVNELKRQVDSLERVELLVAPSVEWEDNSPVAPEYAHQLVEVLQTAWRLDSFVCDWPFSTQDTALICRRGVANCPSLTEFGLSVRRGRIGIDALAEFSSVISEHPGIVSLWLGDIGPYLPGPIFDLLAAEKSKIERLMLSLTAPSADVLQKLTRLLEKNKSITALNISPSRHLYGKESLSAPEQDLDKAHAVRILDLANAMTARIKRLVLYTPALRLDDDRLIAVMSTLLTDPRQRLQQLQIICDGTITDKASLRLKALVERYQPKEIVTHRMVNRGMEMVPGTYAGHLQPWKPRFVCNAACTHMRARTHACTRACEPCTANSNMCQLAVALLIF